MEQRMSLVTLGVTDLARSCAFYEGLGWRRSVKATDGVAFFQLGGTVLSLYPRTSLAADLGVAPDNSGFAGITLAHNTRSREAVDAILVDAVAAGATLVKAGHVMFWGGYVGFFADPDGFIWEIAWNPHFPMAEDGRLMLPE